MSRFFHSLVVMGAAISASNCGGKAREGTLRNIDGVAGSGGSTGAGGHSATGGARVGGFRGDGGRASGGAMGSGGPLAAGGYAVDDAGGVFLPDPGTLAQWSCEGLFAGCSYSADAVSRRQLLNQACPVDRIRPRSAADCPIDQVFQCRGAVWSSTQTPIAVECECVPASDAGCFCQVPVYGEVPAVCTERERLCGCALTVILH